MDVVIGKLLKEMSLVFPTTDDMIRHLTDSAKSMMVLPLFFEEDDEPKLPPSKMWILSVANTFLNNPFNNSLNLEAISNGDIHPPNVVKDVLDPLGMFGASMNLVRSWRVKLPGSCGMCYSTPTGNTTFHPVPINPSVERDDMDTYIGAYHLFKTKKESVCPGDRLVLMIRVQPHLLFGLLTHMEIMLEKDVEAFYSDVTSGIFKD